VIENVPHFLTGKNTVVRNYLKRATYYINKSCRTNYRLNIITLNAANYGVPQIRERVFIIASRTGLDFKAPEIRFHSKPDFELELEQFRSCWDAIGHLSNPNGKYQKSDIGGKWGHLLNSIPPGKNYLWHTQRGEGRNVFKWRSRYWNFLLKLHPDLPSWTIPAQPGQFIGPFHWENRKLTIREAALIQTVPENYRFSGTDTSIRKQIGNGVPAALGELIGKEIKKQFFRIETNSEKLELIPKKRRKGKLYKSSIAKRFQETNI
jgi:DNA (cytosine-5)-methyltransferase 1